MGMGTKCTPTYPYIMPPYNPISLPIREYSLPEQNIKDESWFLQRLPHLSNQPL